MNDVSDEDKHDILDELDQVIALSTPEYRQEGDFTILEFITRWNQKHGTSVTDGFARRHLDNLVKQGYLECHKRVIDPNTGRRCNVWRLVKTGQDSEDSV